MSQTMTRTTHADTSPGAVGLIIFAAVMLMLGGIWQFFAGLVALVNDTFYVVGEEYIFQFDVTTWGWIHLLLGVVVFLAGMGLLSGATWANVVGITVAALSALAMFAWLPWYPLWAILVITLDVLVIWAIAAHGGDLRAKT